MDQVVAQALTVYNKLVERGNRDSQQNINQKLVSLDASGVKTF
jgi:hypothetical protein